MKKYLALVVLSISITAHADWLVDYFNGNYKISSRKCESVDLDCVNAKLVTVGYDKTELKNFVTETYKDNTQKTVWLSEDTIDGESAYITGDAGLSAIWTHEKRSIEAVGSVYFLESVELNKKYPGVNYNYSVYKAINKVEKIRFSRNFTLIKM